MMIKAHTIFLILMIFGTSCSLNTRTIVTTGEAARSQIVSSGVNLPTSAFDLYYAHQPQFADHLDTWISFSADPVDCMATAKKVAGRKVKAPAFVSGTRSRSEFVNGGPAYHRPEFATSHWDLSTVKNGKVFETKDLFVLVDVDANKVYLSLRTP